MLSTGKKINEKYVKKTSRNPEKIISSRSQNQNRIAEFFFSAENHVSPKSPFFEKFFLHSDLIEAKLRLVLFALVGLSNFFLLLSSGGT